MASGHRALQNVTIGTSPTMIVPNNQNRCHFEFRVPSTASGSIFVGGSDVATSGATQGLEVKAGEPYWDGKSPYALYGIVASGTVTIGGSECVHVDRKSVV